MFISQGTGRIGTILFAHGAGIAMDHRFMQTFSTLLADHGFQVIRFEFPYMQHRRATGKQIFPDKLDLLQDSFKQAAHKVRAESKDSAKPIFLLGKSLGGRVATMIADDLIYSLPIAGVFVLGYPFHPLLKPQKLRIEHLQDIKAKVVVFQGERDTFGSHQEVCPLIESLNITIHWFEDADHDLKPRVKSGFSHTQHLFRAASLIAQHARNLLAKKVNL